MFRTRTSSSPLGPRCQALRDPVPPASRVSTVEVTCPCILRSHSILDKARNSAETPQKPQSNSWLLGVVGRNVFNIGLPWKRQGHVGHEGILGALLGISLGVLLRFSRLRD